MKPAGQTKAPKRPTQPTHDPSAAIPSSSVFDFPVSENQESRSAVSQSSRQDEDKDPRSTRLSRQQAARGTEEQGPLYTEGILNTVPPVNF